MFDNVKIGITENGRNQKGRRTRAWNNRSDKKGVETFMYHLEF